MKYDAIIIGAGLSGLSAASLLAKSGLKVAVIEQSQTPGGTCGIFKRKGATFDQGTAMLYGFGPQGFNSHRFLFNCLEEPFQVLKHDLLYVVYYKGKKISFYPDVPQFIEELSQHFPKEANNIRRFYLDMEKCYRHVISENPNYTTPDETDPKDGLKGILRHPFSYLRFLSYLNISSEKLLKKYFHSQDILDFFSKLTSTYCYATIQEAPAILASVMFIDNHVGGSYYPAGSTLFLPGKLEKVIEYNDGDMYYESKAEEFLFEGDCVVGVKLSNGQSLFSNKVIYSGTVWNLYHKLLPPNHNTLEEIRWVNAQIPTYSSVVLYCLVDASVIPNTTCPIEMLSSDNDTDETEITLYTLSIDDPTLCTDGQQVVIAIGPSFRTWKKNDPLVYQKQKEQEIRRILARLEEHFPGFQAGLRYRELATPKTIEHFTLKNNGSCAGPKQMLGQHMLHRQSIRTRHQGLYVCGESTTLGTGTPTVTTSGIAAANAVLKDLNYPLYRWNPKAKDYIEILTPPLDKYWRQKYYTSEEAELMESADKCYYCMHPSCCKKTEFDVPGILRRIACGNFYGAYKKLSAYGFPSNHQLQEWERHCMQNTTDTSGVAIEKILTKLLLSSNTMPAHSPKAQK